MRPPSIRRLSISRQSSALRSLYLLSIVLLLSAAHALAQTSQLSGTIRDPQGLAVPGAAVSLTSIATNATRETTSGSNGEYSFAAVHPGAYRLDVSAGDHWGPVARNLRLEVGSDARYDIALKLAGVTETTSVVADAPILGTRDGSVGTAIDQRTILNMPLSGRSFHSLVELAPGVVTVAGGNFAVNGQRTDANYFMVDGVSANVDAGRTNILGDAAVGATPSSNSVGSLSALAAVEALQEFKVQTSTFAPEFGRGPGAQVSMVTRSGTNAFRGTLFEQLRNDALDANDWFLNSQSRPKPPLRQNDFGGVVGGPVLRDRLFFFGSYDGLRLRLPRVTVGSVPSLEARAAAPAAVQPLLNAFPAPTGPAAPNMLAQYVLALSDPSESDTWGTRIDGVLKSGTRLFVRYNEAPSSSVTNFVSVRTTADTQLHTVTAGATHAVGERLVFDARFNFTDAATDLFAETVLRPGAQALPDAWRPLNTSTSVTSYVIGPAFLDQGASAANTQQQWNVTGTAILERGLHQFKVGVDFRRLSPSQRSAQQAITVLFNTMAQALTATAPFVFLESSRPVTGRVNNFSLFIQDSWRTRERLTLTYGLRWDVNPAPSFGSGQAPFVPLQTTNMRELAFAPDERPLWKTRYGSLAPRVGFSFGLDESARTVVTGGAGVFYDIGTQAAGTLFSGYVFPNYWFGLLPRVAVPLDASIVDRFETPSLEPPYSGTVAVIDPELRAPRTYQWNVTLQRELDSRRAVSLAYIGALGRELLKNTFFPSPNARFPDVVRRFANDAESRYRALQLQYRERSVAGLQITASYTLGSSKDNVSAAVAVTAPDDLFLSDEWGPSDFDVRHTFVAAASWNVPSAAEGLAGHLSRGWSFDGIVRWRSALPFTVVTGRDSGGFGVLSLERPDVVPGQPTFLRDPTAPGGRRVNPDAFELPEPGRQGSLGRNALRGFRSFQVDLGVRRSFSLTNRFKLQTRVDAFNVFNQPNFGPPAAILGAPGFGTALGSLNTVPPASGPGLNPLFQAGGARALELGLRLSF